MSADPNQSAPLGEARIQVLSVHEHDYSEHPSVGIIYQLLSGATSNHMVLTSEDVGDQWQHHRRMGAVMANPKAPKLPKTLVMWPIGQMREVHEGEIFHCVNIEDPREAYRQELERSLEEQG